MSSPTTPTAVIRRVVRDLVRDGYVLDYVYNFEDDVEVKNQKEAIYEITQTDEAFLHVAYEDGVRAGWVRLVPCNPEPCDVIADYTVNLEDTIGPIFEDWL